jgi:hypothetical protein
MIILERQTDSICRIEWCTTGVAVANDNTLA